MQRSLKFVAATVATSGWVIALGTVLSTAADFNAQDDRVNHFQQAALWINANLPEDVVIGAHSAGALAYHVENRAVVNLDGLINSNDYLQVMKEGQFPDYVLNNIDYYADYNTADLESTGICWEGGCVTPAQLRLLQKWELNDTDTYFIFEVLP